jgi:hypothetical protein
MIRLVFAVCLIAVAAVSQAEAKPAQEDRAGAFKAAGFRLQRGEWRKCGDPGTASYTPGSLEMVGDLNGDGLPEAVATEGSAFCYGHTGTAFVLVSKGKNGWRVMMEDVGIPAFLKTKGKGGWPDIEVGGPGFCFPVYRWDGVRYLLTRHQYEGKPCRP